MSLLEIMLLLVAISAIALYFFTKQIVKEQKKEIQKSEIRFQEIVNLNNGYSEKNRNQALTIEMLNQVMEEHGIDFQNLQAEHDALKSIHEFDRTTIQEFKSLYENAKEEIRELLGRINEATQNDPRAIQLLLQYYDHRFVNSATINVNSITLKDIELIHESHIKVIRSLAAKGYFREDLASRFNYNPKTGTVDFNLIEFDDDTPIDTLPWSAFLLERKVFIQTITEYIEGVIGQREINKAVEEAIEGKKEVANA